MTTTSKTPATTKHCFARRHLTTNESALYNYMLAASRRDGEFRSDARRDAWDLGVNKDSITAWTKSLLKKGWIAQTRKAERNPQTGMYSCVHYRVLTHDEWVAKHGEGECRYLEDYYQGNAASPTNPTAEKNHLSDEIGQDSRVTCPNTSPNLSETARTTCPKRVVPPVRPNRTKYSSKGSKKEGEQQNRSLPSSNPPAAVLNAKELADRVVAIAIVTNPKASFNAKSKAEIMRIIEDANPAKDELASSVEAIVSQLDDFQLRNAGSAIAASLTGHLIAAKVTKAEAERKAAIHNQEMKVVEESIAQHEASLEKAVAEAKAEEERRRQHYPDDPFCACPTCQPDFWVEDSSQHSESASA